MNLGKKIGILGGGQLASMLAESAVKLGHEVHIYSPSKADPSAKQTAFHTQGELTDLKKIKKWSEALDAITFESEFTDLKDLKLKNVAPSKKNMKIIRDRLSQKKLLKKHGVPTSPFSKINITKLAEESKTAVVFKQRLFGYDGYGTVICKNKSEVSKFMTTKSNLEDWIREDFIPFKRELAFSIARTKKGSFCVLPLVETFQKNSKCFWVKGPITHKKLPALIKKLKAMLSASKYVGIIAVELFETKKGELLVNELAPRVHNSAHYSIEGLSLSQFDVHNLAVLGETLPKEIIPKLPFAMVNLIGSSNKTPKITLPKLGSLHWYRKKPNKPGRKMGHITVLDKTAHSALKSALKEEKMQSL